MMNIKKTILVLGVVFITAGCTAITDLKTEISDRVLGREPVNPPAELEDITPTVSTKVDWSLGLGKMGRFSFSPAVQSDFVYACSNEGDVYQLDAKTGKSLWHTELDIPLSGGVGVGGGLVLIGSSKGQLIALNNSGKKVWSSNLSSEIQGVPRYFNDLVIVRTSDQHIYGIDAVDGRKKWVFERNTPSLALKTYAGIVVDGGAVYAGFPGGKMVAIRADNGKMIWETTVAQPKGVTEIERIADVTSLPFVDGPLVYAVAYQGRVTAIDRKTGQSLWNRDISSYSGLTSADDKIYVSHALGSVYSLDYNNGKTFWRQGNLAYRNLTAPLLVGSVVVVGDLEGYVHLLSKEDGKFVGRSQLGSDAISEITLGTQSNQFLAQTRGGQLYAVSIK